MTWPPPAGWKKYRIVWNWNQWGAAWVASEAGCIPAISRDRSFIYSPYSTSMTIERLREAWWRLDRGRDQLPFPRRIYPAVVVDGAAGDGGVVGDVRGEE